MDNQTNYQSIEYTILLLWAREPVPVKDLCFTSTDGNKGIATVTDNTGKVYEVEAELKQKGAE